MQFFSEDFFNNQYDALMELLDIMSDSSNWVQASKEVVKKDNLIHTTIVHKHPSGAVRTRILVQTKISDKEKNENLKESIKYYKELLKDAIESQQFEEAAQFRDEIRNLEEELNDSDSEKT